MVFEKKNRILLTSFIVYSISAIIFYITAYILTIQATGLDAIIWGNAQHPEIIIISLILSVIITTILLVILYRKYEQLSPIKIGFFHSCLITIPVFALIMSYTLTGMLWTQSEGWELIALLFFYIPLTFVIFGILHLPPIIIQRLIKNRELGNKVVLWFFIVLLLAASIGMIIIARTVAGDQAANNDYKRILQEAKSDPEKCYQLIQEPFQTAYNAYPIRWSKNTEELFIKCYYTSVSFKDCNKVTSDSTQKICLAFSTGNRDLLKEIPNLEEYQNILRKETLKPLYEVATIGKHLREGKTCEETSQLMFEEVNYNVKEETKKLYDLPPTYYIYPDSYIHFCKDVKDQTCYTYGNQRDYNCYRLAEALYH